MLVTKCPKVVADSHEMKCTSPYFSIMAGWCTKAMAKVVFPIPPGPSIAAREGSQRKISMRSFSSDSRPWNIFGVAGSREREPELPWEGMSVYDDIMVKFIHLVFKELLPI
jgi:hypothetical protein